MNRGKYIVLEGAEGVGKSIQLQELAKRLQAAGLPVRTLREPDSQSDLTARAIRQLTQDPRYPMNTRAEVLLYNAARAQSLQVIKQSVEQGVICLVDRNYLTTLAIQYYGRGDVPDYQAINTIINFAVGGIEPDLCIVLDAPVNVLMGRLKNRNGGERYDNLPDAFLERVRAGYLWEAKQRGFPVVFATDEPEKVADNIWKLVSKELAIREQAQARVTPPASVKEIIEQKQAFVQSNEEDPKAIEDLKLLQDDSELAQSGHDDSSKVVIKNASDLMTVKIRGTVGTYETLETDAEPRFYTPGSLKHEVQKQYEQSMKALSDKYGLIVKKLTEHLGDNSRGLVLDTAGLILPLATMTEINLLASGKAYEDLVIRLMTDELPEAREAAKSLLLKVSGKAKDFDKLINRQASMVNQMKKVAKEYLPEPHAAVTNGVSLMDYWPKNELLLVADMLYEYSNLPLEQLQSIVNSWPYEQKMDVFKTYTGKPEKNSRQIPGTALQKVHYSWDLVCDFNTFRRFKELVDAEDISWQLLTPRYGYAVPSLIEEAGLTDEFEACFDISLKLYSTLQQAGHYVEAQYAVLRGHKMRLKATCNAKEIFGLVGLDDQKEGSSYLELATKMQEKVSEVHPLLAEAMKPVDEADSTSRPKRAARGRRQKSSRR